MSKESVIKFLENVKKDSALQDIRRGLNKGKTKVGIVNYLTEEANQRGYEFTALELEEELVPWFLSAQSELLETPEESIEGSGEKPQSIQEPIEQPEVTKKSTQKSVKMATKKSTRTPAEESTETPMEESTETSTEESTETSTDASIKIAAEISTTPSSTSQMLSSMALSQPIQSVPQPRKITALEKVKKVKLSDLNGRIWA
ncbi:MAG: Nif11-like leader peptide family natural product precursor [Nostoc sp. ChiQUE02]|uniref:Nif11-like leader peptide family natural product precursor n=1 Tax=Nostoc sp. ChiQUE02 TaxID=3075377 RepID=UPI002AD2DEAD|nr:Nif11-like leader peptide family natural product precursor [Nostoc sp. ChiQUE02]MDZ8230218.1 Nif11-like leader peptide family natural product precursor [Nostoc sp. ChiQUE02]